MASALAEAASDAESEVKGSQPDGPSPSSVTVDVAIKMDDRHELSKEVRAGQEAMSRRALALTLTFEVTKQIQNKPSILDTNVWAF